MEIINTTNLQKAISEIKSSKERLIIVRAQSDEFNRKILEYGKFQILLSPETNTHKHNIRQIDSGFNHVLAKIASKNNIAIGIDSKEISSLSKKEKSERIIKISQNIKICRKANTKLAVKKNKENASFLISIGASTIQTKETLYF